MKPLYLILLAALAAGALYITNPDSASFSVFLSHHVQEELADDVPGETELGKKLRKGLGQIAGAAGAQLAERQDWYFASVYSIDIAGDPHVFLGVAGHFFPVKSR